MNRRDFFKATGAGLGGIFLAKMAPAFIGSSVLMPVKDIFVPQKEITLEPIILRVEPAKHIQVLAENYLGYPNNRDFQMLARKVTRWDDEWNIVSDTDPWNPSDARLLS